MPQGLATSTLLFITYLDELQKNNDLLKHNPLAFADDLAFITHNIQELDEVIEKLSKLSPYLSLNFSKCGIIALGKNRLLSSEEYLQIPIKQSYKYLGVQISKTTKATVQSAMLNFKRFYS